MISEQQQEQAALYALDSLDALEAAAFERELADNAELQALVRELRDSAAALALSVPQQKTPSPALKQRVLQQIASEAQPEPANVIRPSASAFRSAVPWAIAAALMILCGVLAVDRAKLRQQLARAERQSLASKPMLIALVPAEGAPAKAQALVAWDATHQIGTIKISNLTAAKPGKDYQLWAIDAAHPDPISAGIVRLSSDGSAEVQFKPTAHTQQVKAFAISLEAEGGVAKKEGPIVLVGSA